jgi:hypothetical protein
MPVNKDFKDLLAIFAAHDVRFLVVGAYAVTFHARPRFTKDLDVWVDPKADNAAKVFVALAAFGAPLRSQGIEAQDFSTPGIVYQIGVEPNRIGILTTVDGLEFSPCYQRRVLSKFDDVPCAYLSREDLITNKRAVGRPKDLEDLKELERH